MNSTKRDIHYTVQYTIMSVKYRKTNKTKINNTKILTSIALKGDGNSVIAAPTPVDESGPCTGNCPCGRPDNEENMIACGNSECNIGWYHLSCAGMADAETLHSENWFCPGCEGQCTASLVILLFTEHVNLFCCMCISFFL